MPKQKPLTFEEVASYLLQMVGKIISKTWRGYGSAIFFEIGELDEEQIGKMNFNIKNLTGT